MFDAAYVNANGIAVQSVDMGMEYSKDGKTVSIIGEQEQGEIHLNDTFIGYYTHDFANGNVVVTAANNSLLIVLDCNEEAFEAYAAKLLAA